MYTFVSSIYNDNVFRYKTHFGTTSYGKTILDTNRIKIPDEELKYSRMFFATCNSCNYYVGTFHRGKLFCTTSDLHVRTSNDYLRYYLQGYSDEEILRRLNDNVNLHEFIDFGLKPPSMR